MSRDYKMPFGKFKGETLEEIYIEDVGYLEWLRDQRISLPPHGVNDALVRAIDECFKQMRNVRICK